MTDILKMVKYNADGLVPAVTQDIRTDEVLMLAYMNEESLRKTVETGKVHYYSRSRQKLWLKGETSGHFQQVRSISLDCDGDTLLLKVEQTGAACHTGHRSCFFTKLDVQELKEGILKDASRENSSDNEGWQNNIVNVDSPQNCTTESDIKNAVFEVKGISDVQRPENIAGAAGAEVLQEEFDVIYDRLLHPKEGSYTNYLFNKGIDKILKKIGEEACEVVIASKNGSKSEIKGEIADLLYHVMVLMAERGMTLQDIYDELKQRK